MSITRPLTVREQLFAAVATRTVLRKSEYEALKEVCPALFQDVRYPRLLAYILRASPDEDTGLVPAPHWLINRVIRGDHRLGPNDRDHHLDVRALFDAMECDTGIVIQTREPYFLTMDGQAQRGCGISRGIKSMELPPPIAQAIYARDPQSHRRRGLVDAATGRLIPEARLNEVDAYRRAEINAANRQLLDTEGNSLVEVRGLEPWLNYCHALSPQRYHWTDDVLQQALDTRDQIVQEAETHLHEIANQRHTAKAKEHYLTTELPKQRKAIFAATTYALQESVLFPRPIYKLVGLHTPRLYQDGVGLQTIHRDLRHILLHNTIELDLRNAHAAIISRIAEIPALYNILAANRSLWTHLLEVVEWPDQERCWLKGGHVLRTDVRAVVKQVVNTTIYGGQPHLPLQPRFYPRLSLKAQQWLSQPTQRAALLQCEVIRELKEAVRQLLKRIKREGGMHDAYGTWIPLDVEQEITPATVLSAVNCSYELQLLAPLRDLTLEWQGRKHGWDVLLYQHDGLSMRPRDWRDADKIIARCQEAVREVAGAMGIPTDLEVAHRPKATETAAAA